MKGREIKCDFMRARLAKGYNLGVKAAASEKTLGNPHSRERATIEIGA